MRLVPKSRKSILFRWISSYLLIFAIPAIISFIIYSIAVKIIEDNLDKANTYVLSQIQVSFDSIITNSHNVSLQIALDSDINNLIALDSYTANDLLKISELVKKLNSIKANNTVIDDFYIYLKKTNSILRYTGFIDSTTSGDFIPINDEYSIDMWYATINNRNSNKIFPYIYKSAYNTVTDSISTVMPLPLYSGEPVAYIIINVNANRFQSLMTKIYKDSNFLILDNNSSPIYSTYDKSTLNHIASNFQNGEVPGEIIYNGQKLNVSHIDSGFSAIKYINIVPSNIYWQPLDFVKNFALILSLICVVFGIICSWLFSKKNYKPIKNMLEIILSNNISTNPPKNDEYAFLINSVKQLITDKNTIDNKFFKQRDSIKTNILSKIINRSRKNNFIIEDMATSSDLDFPYDNFGMLAFFVYDYENFSSSNSENDYELFFLIIKNIFEELINEDNVGYVCEINGTISCIVNIQDKNTEHFSNEINDIIAVAQKVIMENFQIDIAVSVSNIYESLNNLSVCYEETITGIEYLSFRKSNGIVFYKDINVNKSNSVKHYFSFEQERELTDSIAAGDFSKAKNIFENILNACIQSKDVDIDMTKGIIFNIIAAIMKVAHETLSYCSEVMPLSYTDIASMNIPDTSAHIIDYLENLCEYIRGGIVINENKTVEDIKNYIEKEYCNLNLNISNIADALHYNSTYLSRLFANRTGERLLDYINKIRIKKSKELLLDDKLTLDDIAIMVGYNNSNSYIRIFKKYELITPGRYRQVHQQ